MPTYSTCNTNSCLVNDSLLPDATQSHAAIRYPHSLITLLGYSTLLRTWEVGSPLHKSLSYFCKFIASPMVLRHKPCNVCYCSHVCAHSSHICKRGNMINDFVILCGDRGSAGVGGSILLEIGGHLKIVETNVRSLATLQEKEKKRRNWPLPTTPNISILE